MFKSVGFIIIIQTWDVCETCFLSKLNLMVVAVCLGFLFPSIVQLTITKRKYARIKCCSFTLFLRARMQILLLMPTVIEISTCIIYPPI